MYVVMYLKSFQPDEVAAILSKNEILYLGGTIQYEDGFKNCDYTTFVEPSDPHIRIVIKTQHFRNRSLVSLDHREKRKT